MIPLKVSQITNRLDLVHNGTAVDINLLKILVTQQKSQIF